LTYYLFWSEHLFLKWKIGKTKEPRIVLILLYTDEIYPSRRPSQSIGLKIRINFGSLFSLVTQNKNKLILCHHLRGRIQPFQTALSDLTER
jgi:hypothetical protein